MAVQSFEGGIAVLFSLGAGPPMSPLRYWDSVVDDNAALGNVEICERDFSLNFARGAISYAGVARASTTFMALVLNLISGGMSMFSIQVF